MARAHSNVVTVALADRMARVIWAVLSKGETYRPPLLECRSIAALTTNNPVFCQIC
ncbi:MAG TPA: hypothetical protein VGF88_13455 [Acidobacteriaceae bacterium]